MDVHPDFRVGRLDRLPKKLRAIANRALLPDASPDDLTNLRQVLEECDESSHRYLLPALFALLDPLRIPLRREIGDPTDAALFALQAAALAMTHIFSNERHRLAEVYLSVWPRITDWLFLALEAEPVLPLHIWDEIDDAFVPFLMAAMRCGPGASIPIATSQLVTVLAHCWARTVAVPVHTQNETDARRSCLNSLVYVHNDLLRTAVWSMDAFLLGIGGTLFDLARLLTGHFMILSTALPHDTAQRTLNNSFLFVSRICGESDTREGLSPINFVLASPKSGYIQALTRVIKAIAEKLDPQWGDNVLLLRLAIQTHLGNSKASRATVISAVEAGLLDAIVTIGERWPKNPAITAQLSVMMTQGVAGIAIFASNLRRISDAVEGPYNRSELPAFEASSLSKAWIEMLTVVAPFDEVLQEYDKRLVAYRGCDNLQCQKIGHRADFKRCTGCRSMHYCSRECQSADWKPAGGNHRSTCRAYRQWHDHVAASYTTSDLSFLRYFFATNYTQCRREFKSLHDSASASAETETETIMTMNYTDPQPALDAVLASDATLQSMLPAPSVLPRAVWLDMRRRARESGGRMLLHCVWIPALDEDVGIDSTGCLLVMLRAEGRLFDEAREGVVMFS
ncbi:MYND-type domain-containing protein [Mycena kentingensis (nom. inval.)]|nr:MYND-type domain-containing protein [Mycena kentingensis (nom. inval.)]